MVNSSIDNNLTEYNDSIKDTTGVFVEHDYTPNTYPYTININFNSRYIDFLAHVSSDNEPSSYEQAKESEEWQLAMKQELEALERNGTWKITDLPPGSKAIGCRWV